MSWSNLALWNTQVALLAVAAAALAAAFRLRPTPVRQVYWQALLVLCLALPAIQPWRSSIVVTSPAATPTAIISVPAHTPAPAPRAPSWGWSDAVLAVLAAGTLLRAARFGMGLFRLARYRRAAQRLDPLPAPVDHACRALGLHLEIGITGEISGPVTFGFRRPVILLPANFPALDPAIQSAVATHELLHVQRHDWLFTALEELVRCVFWYHPVIWWMLGQIQLAREQSVDRAVVALSQSREHYIHALLALSGARPQFDLAPAPLFLGRHHVTARVAALMKETGMSRTRVMSSAAACAGGLLLAGWLVCGRLPLEAAPQHIQDDPGVAVSGAERIQHREAVTYPAEARQKGIQGTVVLDLEVARDGTVTAANVVSGPLELGRTTAASALRWHFRPQAAGRQQVTMNFTATKGVVGGITRKAPGGAHIDIDYRPRSATPGGDAPRGPLPLWRITIVGVSQAADEELRRRLNLQEGQLLDEETLQRVRQTVQDFDANLTVTEGSVMVGRADSVQGPILALRISPKPGATVYPEHTPAPGELGPTLALAKRRLARIDIQGISPEAADELRRRLPVKEGDLMDSDTSRRIEEAVKAFDPHLSAAGMSAGVPRRFGADGKLIPPETIDVTIHIRPAAEPGVPLEQYARLQRAPSFPEPAAGVQRIRVGGAVQARKLIGKVAPVYPQEAKEARIQGAVKFEVLLDQEGKVKALQLIGGHPLLASAATEAVKAWQYAPTLLNGTPVEVIAQVDVNFMLTEQ